MGNSENTKFTRDVWIVEGVDDLESTIFAYCSSKETAEKAKSIVESNGFEDMVKITYSELPMDMIFSGGKMIYLKEKEEMSQTTKAISGKEYKCNQTYLDVTVKAGELWDKLGRFREEIDDLAKQNESSKCESDNLQGHRKEMLLFMHKEAKELDMSFDAFCNQTGDDTSAPANSKYQTSDENQEILKMIEKIQCLESSIPNGCVFQDADTLLADYMGWDIGNEGTGITKEIFDTYKFSTDKLGLMKIFADFVGTEFPEFLKSCVKALEEQKKNLLNGKDEKVFGLKDFYFTFGSDPHFPYQNGYVIVKADDLQGAILKFCSKFPNRHVNCMNCAFFYTEAQWKIITKKYDMGKCHEAIW